MISIDPTAQVNRQVEIHEGRGRTGAQDGTLLVQRLGASLVRGQAGGAADRLILAGQFACEQFLSRGIVGDFLICQQGEQSFLEGAETAFDLTFSLGAGCDQVGDAQRGEGTLELGTRVAAVAGGLVAEEGQAIGVEDQRQAVSGKDAAEVLEVVPGGIGGDEDGTQQLAGVIIERQEEGLLVLGGPPLVDGGIVLPEFAHLCALPSSPRLGSRSWRADQPWEVNAGVGGDGLAVALEGAASSQLIGDELVVGRSLERQEGFQELPHILRPSGAMVTSGEVQGKGGRVLKPEGAQTKEMGAADIQQLGGGGSVELPLVEGVQGLLKEREGNALAELMLFKGPMDARVACRARLFVGLRYAPASSKPGPAGESFLPRYQGRDSVSFCSPQQSHFVPAPTSSNK